MTQDGKIAGNVIVDTLYINPIGVLVLLDVPGVVRMPISPPTLKESRVDFVISKSRLAR